MEYNNKIDQAKKADIRAQSEEDARRDTAEVDIGATDNGYTAITRAFFKAAYANKGQSLDNTPEDGHKSETDKLNESMLMDFLQDEYLKLADMAETMMSEVREQLSDIRAKRQALRDELNALGQETDATLEQHAVLTEQTAEIEQVKETLLTKKEEAEAKTAQALQDQQSCSAEQLDQCSIKDDSKVVALIEKGVEEKSAVAIVAEEKIEEALAEQAQVDKKLQETEARLARLSKSRDTLGDRLEDLQAQAEVNQEKIARNQAIEKKLLEREAELKEFQAKTNDPEFKKAIAEGRVTKAQLDDMTPEFMRKERHYGRTMPAPEQQQQNQDAPAAIKAAPVETRTTTSLASTLNDGGGIKAASLQGPFTAAANGTQPDEAAAMPLSPAIDQNRKMAMNASFG